MKLQTVMLFSLAASSPTAYAQFEACRDYFPKNAVPTVVGKTKLRDICFDSFAVLHSGATKTAVYVVEKLNRARLADAKGERRRGRFYEEARLPRAERATLDDYRGSGYDRGHLAPAGDMPTPTAMAQSFSLANMVPQSTENNRGIWARRVEAATRHYVERAQGDIYVFTGPAYKGRVETIGKGRVWVPTHLFKLVYDPDAGRAWAYWIENTDDSQFNKPISYSELVSHIGFELLPGIKLQR